MSESPSLVWGSTSLVRDETSGLDWWIEASADGTNWGNPEAVVTQIKSHLQDGSLAQVTSDDNRQATVRVQVCAYDYEGLAQGEAALVAEADVPAYSTLTWSPNRLLAKPTVFDVVYATIAFDFDDLAEVKRAASTVLRRRYALTLECLPFGRDDAEVTVTGNSVGSGGSGAPTETPINDGSSTDGWLGGGSPVEASGGAVSAAPSQATGQGYTAFLSRFVTLNVANGRLVYWDWKQNGTVESTPTMVVNGPTATSPNVNLPPAYTTALTNGYTRSYFQIPADNFPVAAIGFGLMRSTAADGDNRLYIDQVTQSTGVQGAGSGGSLRQRTTTVKVGGSARTPARLLVSAPVDLGGATLIYTRQSGSSFQPPLRPWGDAPEVPDAQTFSGGYSSYLQALIPAGALLQGTYNLLTRVTGTGTINYLVEMALAADTTSKPYDSERTAVAGSAATTGGIVDLGLFTLPPFGISSNATYRVRVALSGTGSVMFDEGWLFDVDRGVLSVVNSTYLKSIEIRTPDINLPEPAYFGTYRDGSDEAGQRVRIDSRVKAGEHYFEAGLVDIFTACISEASSVSASFYRRHHTHATEADA